MPADPRGRYPEAVAESIRSVFELATRIDERVLLMMKKQDALDGRLDDSLSLYNQINSRVCVLESKTIAPLEAEVAKQRESVRALESSVQDLRGDTGRAGDRWKQAVQVGLQVLVAIAAAYAIYKLKLKP